MRLAELDAEETETMRPALERMQQRGAKLREEKEQLSAKVTELEDIVCERANRLTKHEIKKTLLKHGEALREYGVKRLGLFDPT